MFRFLPSSRPEHPAATKHNIPTRILEAGKSQVNRRKRNPSSHLEGAYRLRIFQLEQPNTSLLFKREGMFLSHLLKNLTSEVSPAFVGLMERKLVTNRLQRLILDRSLAITITSPKPASVLQKCRVPHF